MSPRRDIGMSAREVDAFLRTRVTTVVVALNADGHATGTVGQAAYRDGGFQFALREDDPVVALLAADNRACCIVEQFPSYYEIKGVTLHGRAQPRGPAADGTSGFDLAVEKVVSFDFGKLRQS